jgi:DNA-binding MarR family transcriptional regulator
MRSFGALSKGLRQWVRSHMGAGPGMTIGRAGVLLGLLERHEPVSMTALGTAQDLTPRAMTVLISGLEKEGLVRRARHPDDGRVTLVSLTPAGRAVAAQQLLPAGKKAAALFGELSDYDRTELLRLLGEVLKHLKLHGIDTPIPLRADQDATRVTSSPPGTHQESDRSARHVEGLDRMPFPAVQTRFTVACACRTTRRV